MPENRNLPVSSSSMIHSKSGFLIPDGLLLGLSILLQVVLGLFFGHAYDMRIFMSSGYLVASGQNPYIAKDLSGIFHNSAFQGITSFGYPPPWALILGLVYLCSYRIIPNFLLYNLAVKLPIIAANIGLAYLVAYCMKRVGAQEKTSHSAWIFMLFNPLLLITTSAWGQFDSIVALLAVSSLLLLDKGRTATPAILLALAVSLKPIALPIIPVVLVYLFHRSRPRVLKYFIFLTGGLLVFCVVPFILFQWDPAVIFQNWDAHSSVGGGLSFMTFLEAWRNSYQLTGNLWILGWLWLPVLVFAVFAIKSGINGFSDLLKKSVALLLVFFLSRAWVSEPNVILILPMVLILTSLGEMRSLALVALWVLPIVFGLFNTSLAQLFFPSMPSLMDGVLKWTVQYNLARFALRIGISILWLVAGGWIVTMCFRNRTVSDKELLQGSMNIS